MLTDWYGVITRAKVTVVNRLKILIYAVSSIVVLTGCQTRLDAPFVDKGAFLSLQTTYGFDQIVWKPDLPRSQRFVSVHPDDGGASAGGVELDLDGSSTAQRLGVNLTAGNGVFRAFAGVDCRFNNITSEIDDDDDDDYWEYGDGPMRDIERQPLTGNFNSYGYAWLEPSDYTWIPYIGVEAEIADTIVLGMDVGAPYSKFTYERGHYRNYVKETIEHDSWRGFGRRGAASVGLRVLDNRGMVGFQYAFERYDARFAGISSDVDAHVFSLFFTLRF